MPENVDWDLFRGIPGMDFNIENSLDAQRKLISIWKKYEKDAKVPDHMLRWLFNSENAVTQAGRLHDLLSVIERTFELEPVFNSPLLSAPTYLSMAGNSTFDESSSSIMLGSLGSTSAIEHDMISNSLGIKSAYHIDKMQSDSKDRYINATGRSTFSIQDAAAINTEDNSIDVTIADYLFRAISIQMADDPHVLTRIMKEIYRILKPGGNFLIIEQMPEWAVKVGFDYRKYIALLIKSLEHAGFETSNVYDVLKYNNRKLAYESFPSLDFDHIRIDKSSTGISARKS